MTADVADGRHGAPGKLRLRGRTPSQHLRTLNRPSNRRSSGQPDQLRDLAMGFRSTFDRGNAEHTSRSESVVLNRCSEPETCPTSHEA